MKSFKSYFVEALNRRQEYYIDREINNAGDYARDTEFSDHVFGGPSSGLGRHDDHDVKIIPFDMSHFQNPPEELVSHLDKHGYKIHDWNNRLAVATNIAPGARARPIRIRKVLQATEGSDGYYAAARRLNEHDDIARHLEKGLEIMITRHPYHVAEQSTNKGWRSCMALGVCPDEDRGFIGDMEHSEAIRSNERGMEQARRLGRANQAAGEHADKVPDDILGGAHMAYLIPKGDYNLKRPLGRISLKPYHSRDIMTKTNNWLYRRKHLYPTYGRMWSTPVKDIPWKDIKPRHTILRPIGRTYILQELARNPLMDHFRDAVTKFTETHFPMDPHEEDYQLDKLVQRDHGENEWIKNPNFGKAT
jgi:hypothetical protein